MDAEPELELLDGHLRELDRVLGGDGAEPGLMRHLLDVPGAQFALGLGELLGDGRLPLDEPLADDVPDQVGGAPAGLRGGEEWLAAVAQVVEAGGHRVILVVGDAVKLVVEPALHDLAVEGVGEEVDGEAAQVAAEGGVVQEGREQRFLGGEARGGDAGLGDRHPAAILDAQAVGDGALGDAEAPGDGLDVGGALDGVADGQQHGSKAVHDAARLQGRVDVGAADQALQQEAREGRGVLDGRAPDLGILAGEVVRILADGQGGNAQVQVGIGGDGLGAALGSAHRLGRAEVEEERARALGGCHAGAVGVHGEDDARGEARQPGRVLLGEGRAHGGDEVAEARLPGTDDVEVALDDDDGAGLARLGTGKVEGVEGAALVEELGLGGVEVLGLALAEDAPAEADELPAVVGDGDDDPSPETVVRGAAGVALVEDAGGEGVLVAVAAPEQVVPQQAPLVGRPAEAELGDGLVAQAARLGEVAAGLGAAFAGKLLLVEVDGGGDDAAEPLGARALLGGPGGKLDAGLLGEDAEGLAEVDVLALLDEGEDIATLAAAAEAAPDAAVDEDIEGARLLGVEGAEAAEVAARLLELDEASDVLDRVDAPLDLGDGVHPEILPSAGLLWLLRLLRFARF